MTVENTSTGRGLAYFATQVQDAASTFSGVDGHNHSDAQRARAIDPILIGDLRELWRQRVDLHKAEKSLTLQIKAKCRRAVDGCKVQGEKMYKSMLNGQEMAGAIEVRLACEPFINARALINAERSATEKMLEKLAKQLPVWPWVETVRGFGALSLAALVGEAGDLWNYATVSKFWKRMGLAVIDGVRQRRVTGADAIKHGYSPQRRSLVWNIGECLIKHQGHYRSLYLAMLVVECERARERGITPATSVAATVSSWEQRNLPQLVKVSKIKDGEHISAAHLHNRAKRKMEKALLRDLWRAWRGLPVPSGE